MFSFFKRLNLTKKLVIIYVSITVITVSTLTFVYYQNFKNALLERTFAQLSSINMLKKAHIEDYVDAHDAFTEVSLPEFNHLLYERTGMGNTGETYVVDDNFRMRSKSRFMPEKDPLIIKVKTGATLSLKKGVESQSVIKDYRGVEVLSVYRFLNIGDDNSWYIMSEIDFEEAMIPVIKVRNAVLLIGLLVLLFVGFITYIISRGISVPIKAAKNRIESLAGGLLHVEPTLYTGNDEVGDISRAINQLIISLKKVISYTHQLSEGDFSSKYTPLSENDEFGIELSKTKEKLAGLMLRNERLEINNKKALLKGQENERMRLAQELHDSIGALLTTTKLSISAIEGNDELKQHLKDLLNNTISEVRTISFNMMPSVLIDFGVGAAIKALVKHLEQLSGLSFNFENSLEENQRFDRDIEINIYRIFQEATNNIIKHSKANNVDLSLSLFQERVIILIEDDGVGFKNKQTKHNTNGLRNIRERVKLLGGEVTINSSPKGTSIEAEIPVKNE